MYRYLDNPTTTVPRSFPLVDAAGGPLLSMCTPGPNTTKWGPDKPITRFIPVSFQDAAPRGCSNAKCRPLPTPVSHKPQHHTTAINIYGLVPYNEETWLCDSAGAGPTCLVLQLANRHSKIQHQLPLSLAPSQQIRLDPETLALNADV